MTSDNYTLMEWFDYCNVAAGIERVNWEVWGTTCSEETKTMNLDRDFWGRLVREAWIKWARTQPSHKPNWLVPYDLLSEADKEANRQIAEAVIDMYKTLVKLA